MEKVKIEELMDATIIRGGTMDENGFMTGHYVFECLDKDGKVKWREEFDNLVTTVGKNKALDEALSGSAYTAAWYLGLVSSVDYSAVAAADTMASHAGWKEAGPTNAPAYSQATRPAALFAAAAAGSKALSSAAVFSITSSGTLKGAFLCSDSAKDGTAGVLLSVGVFTGGDKMVSSGDTVNVSYSLSM